MTSQLQTTLKQVIQTFRAGDFDGANLMLNKALQNDINSADAIFELGIAYARANKFMEALAVFQCLQPHKEDDVRIPYNLGLLYSIKGMHQLALKAYDLALQIEPRDAEVLVNKASACIDLKNYDLALEILEKVTQIRPDIPEAWSNKGIALNNLHLYQESIDAYDEAIRLSSGYHEAWSNKSVPLNKLKRFLDASEVCDKALSIKPDYAEAWSNKGNTLTGLKRYDEALACIDKALSIKPDYAEAWFNKGLVLHELKRYDEALAHCDKAISLKPDEADYFYQKSLTNIALDQYAIAEENLKDAVKHSRGGAGNAEYLLSALRPENGLKPIPKNFVADLFDEYADSFDEHLVDTLKYDAPSKLMGLLNPSSNGEFELLDMGCGTGLMGRLLKPYAKKIIGIDLSKEMLARAKLTGAYDELFAEDIFEFLNKCSDQFDLVVAADVFIYIGELSNIFMALSRIVKVGGLFCFSVEKNVTGEFSLSPKTLRYSHAKGYIEMLASLYHFKIERFLEGPIRQEKYIDVEGYYFLLKKSDI